MPSPPTAPGTVTAPTLVSDPSLPMRYASTMPFAPVCAYRKRPSDDTAASTVPGSAAVLPSAVSVPLPSSW
jgi:acyl-CoA reductase-like NAD-dependent aldehyde dehydrogenase